MENQRIPGNFMKIGSAGGGWNSTDVVAFLYINNFRIFRVGLERSPNGEVQKIQWPAVGLEIARIIAYSPARVSVRMDF